MEDYGSFLHHNICGKVREREEGTMGKATTVLAEVGMLLQSSIAHNVVFALSVSILSELI